jgi:hypothetical protein
LWFYSISNTYADTCRANSYPNTDTYTWRTYTNTYTYFSLYRMDINVSKWRNRM